MGRFARLAFTPAVQALQEKFGSRAAYARVERTGDTLDVLTDDEAEFLSQRDSFYMASIGSNGWPYIQHRGGPPGFVRVLDPHTLGFADYRGNKQYISAGNVSENDRVALIFVDYPNRARLKVLAHASVITRETDAATLKRLEVPGYDAKVERGFVLKVEGFDWNCPQHITPRFTEAELDEMLRPVSAELQTLRSENRSLREELERLRRTPV
ncbi:MULTISPECIES: pyridoxamine 5'-phosphate oxidase family protein [unclassified Corallococcus]|uniref:pyridoxamine 5'-phosphate oxidase family protein n=1 Tax=unclassified Corallococcus TaxID=2685029 RepID=UPI001A8E662E|nr:MULTISPECIES: pyridoxamine 5'-phosphate oxidase family protein [unclassified Corallococcus]MBN9684833.1 pyridoxamine 5'-phosphate oxidase family protein [Corallococcus sp. NCSPR001]WAS83702.1 pyridoxamine 5'-phosphate oxidase family protein [Corallococcus sp. NCRR]